MRPVALFALMVLTLAGGCAGYRLGPTNGLRAGEKSIQLNPVANTTLEPRLGEEVSRAVRKKSSTTAPSASTPPAAAMSSSTSKSLATPGSISPCNGATR